MFVTYKHTNIHTYIQTLWLLESLDLLDRETKNITTLHEEKDETIHFCLSPYKRGVLTLKI